MTQLAQWVDAIDCVTQVRGLGLMIGIVLDRPGGAIVDRCEKRGLLLNCTAGSVVRLLPPLNVTDEEMDQALKILREEIEAETAQ